MNLLERLSVNGSISSEELSKLSAIRAGLINSMECGQIRTMEFVRKTFEDCSSEETMKLAEMIETIKTALAKEIIREHGIEAYLALEDMMDLSMIKSADANPINSELAKVLKRMEDKISRLQGGGSLSKVIENLPGRKFIGGAATAAILATLGMSLLHSAGQGVGMVANPIKGLVSGIQNKKEGQRNLSEIIEENPELKKDEKVVEYFATLQKFAPHTVAANKPLLESLLKKMHQWGQVDPQTMGQLVEMEGKYLQNVSGGRGEKKDGFRPLSAGDLAALHSGATS